MPTYLAITTVQTLYILLLVQDSYAPLTLSYFLQGLDFSMFEFRFIPIFLLGDITDDYIPLRGIYSEQLEVMGLYYNSVVVNTFRKCLLWTIYFAVILPIALLAR
jgi:hypothetical protein